MITLKEWMELVDYKITEGSDYTWKCYGYSAHTLTSWNGEHEGYSFAVTFDTKNQTVYEVQAHDFANQRAYRMINPEYLMQYKSELAWRECGDEAWDNVNYIDIEVDDDFIQKCLAIKAGEDYDTRIQVPVEFTDEELLAYMKLAHDKDITFNQLVEQALREFIDSYESDPAATVSRAKEWIDNRT